MEKEIIYEQKFSPLADNVLVDPDAAPEETKGGIILPDSAKDDPRVGTVVSIGPDVSWHNEPKPGNGLTEKVKYKRVPNLVPGDRVMCPEAGGTPVVVNGKTYKCFPEVELLGIVTIVPQEPSIK